MEKLGQIIAQSTNQPPNETVTLKIHVSTTRQIVSCHFRIGAPNRHKKISTIIMRFRKFLPSGEMIEVGCSISNELEEIRKDAIMLTLIGGAILLVGLRGRLVDCVAGHCGQLLKSVPPP